jgi:hypothetical protein
LTAIVLFFLFFSLLVLHSVFFFHTIFL